MAIGRVSPSIQSRGGRSDKSSGGGTPIVGPGTGNMTGISFTGAGVSSTTSGGNVTVTIPGDPLEVKDEGITKTTSADSMDFVGAGVTVTNSGDAVTVTIPGTSGGSGLIVKDEGGNITTNAVSMDFVGAGVTATNIGDAITVTIPGTTTEEIQDAIGNNLLDTATINLTYNDGNGTIQADLIGSGASADLATAILANTPTGYWKCDEASGNLADSSGNGFTLVPSGAFNYQLSSLLSGDSTKYAYFGSSTGAASKTGSTLGITCPITGDWSVEAIVRNEPGLDRSFFAITSTGSSTRTDQNSQVRFGFSSSTNLIEVSWESGNGTITHVSPADTSAVVSATAGQGVASRAIHWAAVKDSTGVNAGNVTFYRNGHALRGVGNISAVAYTTDPAGGGDTANMSVVLGATAEQVTINKVMGHVAFYNATTLTAAQVYAHAYAAGLTRD